MLTDKFNLQTLASLCALPFGGSFLVRNNETAFVINHHREIQRTETTPGLHRKWPWHHNVTISSQPRSDSFHAPVNSEGDVAARYPVKIGFSVTDAAACFKHGMMHAECAMQDAIKKAISNAAENESLETLSERRTEIAQQALETTRDDIAKLGLSVNYIRLKEPALVPPPGRNMYGAVISSSFSMMS